MAPVNDVVLLDHPADATGPRSINWYLVEVQVFTAAAPGGEGKKFKLDPQRLLYSLQWLHNDPQLWFDFVATMLLGALAKHDRPARSAPR